MPSSGSAVARPTAAASSRRGPASPAPSAARRDCPSTPTSRRPRRSGSSTGAGCGSGPRKAAWPLARPLPVLMRQEAAQPAPAPGARLARGKWSEPADPARNYYSGVNGHREEQPGNRRRVRAVAKYGQETRGKHFIQVGRRQPHPGRDAGKKIGVDGSKNTPFLLLLSADNPLPGEYLKQKDTSGEFAFLPQRSHMTIATSASSH